MSIQAVPNVAALNAFLSTAPGQLHVLDFWASWCGPCTAIAPVYAALAKQYPGVSFGKVDVDAATDVARAYSISAMPTFVFIKGGKVIETIKGANPAALKAAVAKYSTGGAATGGAFPGSGNSLSGGAAPVPVVAGQSSWFVENAKLILIGSAVMGLWLWKGSETA